MDHEAIEQICQWLYDESVNECIRRRTERDILHVGGQGKSAIDRRIKELDMEWDVERMLEANAASLALLGLGLGVFVDRRFFPAVVTSFLLQHAIQGWCPPLPILRGLGIRTAGEIDIERYALKAIRGDFKDLPDQEKGLVKGDAEHALEAAAL